MDPEEFLELAERLICSSVEAEKRTAVSRAYYAVFHRMRIDIVGVDGEIAHPVLQDCLSQGKGEAHEVEEFALLYRTVRDLHTDRRFADYTLHEPLPDDTCKTMVLRCLEALEDFEVCCKELGLISAAKGYLRNVMKMRI